MYKKRVLAVILVFNLLLMITIGITLAGNPAYSVIEYGASPATFDGVWTTADEWLTAPVTQISDNAVFVYCMDFNTYSVQWLVEIFDDTTDDAEDYWQFCVDDGNAGGSAPQAGDFKIEIVGHTTLTVYEGTGSGWTEVTPATGEITWANSISDSPLESTPHWILEFSFVKTEGNAMIPNAPPTGLRVAVYDASNSAAGVQAWAPGSADVPSEWGQIGGYSMDPYEPEPSEPEPSEPEPSEPEPSEPEPSEPEPVAPQASFTYSPLSPQVNDTITFDSSDCDDPDGSIVSYSWDFGDGSTSATMNPLHSYDQEGSYTVTLTVTDNDGLTDTTTKTISDVVIPEFSSIAVLFVALTTILMIGIHYKKKMKKQT